MIRHFLSSAPRLKSGFRRGFTLVELLVVIGIIALLISILLPALNRARQAGQSVQCASNLRQLYLGAYMYAQDNNGCFPCAYPNNGTVYLPVMTRVLASPVAPTYIRNQAVWNCPSDITSGKDFASYSWSGPVIPGGYCSKDWVVPPQDPGANLSYGYNQTAGFKDNENVAIDARWMYPPYRPAKRGGKVTYDPIFFDAEAGNDLTTNNFMFFWQVCYFKAVAGKIPSYALYSGRHGAKRDRINVVGGDGHVESLLITQGQDLEKDAQQGKIPWQPDVRNNKEPDWHF